MKKLVNDFLDRYFHDEESIILMLLLSVGLAVLLFFGGVLAPLITAIIVAYLMQGLVEILLRQGLSARIGVHPRLRGFHWCVPLDAAVPATLCLESATQANQ